MRGFIAFTFLLFCFFIPTVYTLTYNGRSEVLVLNVIYINLDTTRELRFTTFTNVVIC